MSWRGVFGYGMGTRLEKNQGWYLGGLESMLFQRGCCQQVVISDDRDDRFTVMVPIIKICRVVPSGSS